VFSPTELEVFGYQTYGDEAAQFNANMQFPVYAKSGVYCIKRYNGSREALIYSIENAPTTLA
jgi:hypothetical protein